MTVHHRRIHLVNVRCSSSTIKVFLLNKTTWVWRSRRTKVCRASCPPTVCHSLSSRAGPPCFWRWWRFLLLLHEMGSAGGASSTRPVTRKKRGKQSTLKNFHNLLHFSTHQCFRCDWFCGKYQTILRILSTYTRGHMFPPPCSLANCCSHPLTPSLHFFTPDDEADQSRVCGDVSTGSEM